MVCIMSGTPAYSMTYVSIANSAATMNILKSFISYPIYIWLPWSSCYDRFVLIYIFHCGNTISLLLKITF